MNYMQYLNSPPIRALRDRYHELTGEWLGYNFDDFRSLDDYVETLRRRIKECEEAANPPT